MNTNRRPSGLGAGLVFSVPCPDVIRCGVSPPLTLTRYRSDPLSPPRAYTIELPSGVKTGVRYTALRVGPTSGRARPVAMSMTTIWELGPHVAYTIIVAAEFHAGLTAHSSV